MIIVRAPLRISFVGGGSDLQDFYRLSPGKVISATIDKYVYVAINPAPLLKGITARYAIIETVNSPKDLKNDRIRETMLLFGIKDNMELGIFSHLPTGVGLGGSSAFTVALLKGLSTYAGKRLTKKEIAEDASRIEIDTLKEPIGKQDQYSISFGGINVFQFNSDESVDIDPVFLDYKKRLDFESHISLFFTGRTRQTSSVIGEQKTNTVKNRATIQSMVNLVDIFKSRLLAGDFENLGKLLHENWLKKKTLASKISNPEIDTLYEAGIRSGAWGGKVLGAGGGGCILFLSPLNRKDNLFKNMKNQAKKLGLDDFKEIPVKFVHTGVEIVSNSLF